MNLDAAAETVPAQKRSQTISITDINAEHRLAQEAFGEAVQHAIRAGELLAAAKAQLGHGEWLPWLELNFDFSRQTASAYMRLAANREQIEMESAPSISAALKQLAPGPPTSKPEPPPPAPYIADTERKVQLAKAAREKLFRVASAPASLDAICTADQGPSEALNLDRALAVASDEEIDNVISDLDHGIRRYKELRDELRRRRS